VYLKTVFNLLVTLLMWLYFTAGFVLLFSPFYLWAYLFSKNREFAFQRLNHYFFQGFFFLLKHLAPRVKWNIPNELKNIKSSVVVCNHSSFLDPLLMIELFSRHTTIVKSTFFKVPVFGWLLKHSGFIPPDSQGRLSALMIERIEALDGFLASGGNLFVFPEGTRSRDGSLGPFNKGAFKIARHCQAPIQVLKITGTGEVFAPDRFLFKALNPITITVERVAMVDPEYQSSSYSTTDTMNRVRSLLEH
jgi:1-acyl-sn-glycerol-3-phosphate acyltransferase